MLIGYTRVSKADGSQTLDLQLDEPTDVNKRQIYIDHASGKKDDRPGLESCLKALRKGDTLLVWKLDPLGRNLTHLVKVIDELHTRDVSLKGCICSNFSCLEFARLLWSRIGASEIQFETRLV